MLRVGLSVPWALNNDSISLKILLTQLLFLLHTTFFCTCKILPFPLRFFKVEALATSLPPLPFLLALISGKLLYARFLVFSCSWLAFKLVRQFCWCNYMVESFKTLSKRKMFGTFYCRCMNPYMRNYWGPYHSYGKKAFRRIQTLIFLFFYICPC